MSLLAVHGLVGVPHENGVRLSAGTRRQRPRHDRQIGVQRPESGPEQPDTDQEPLVSTSRRRTALYALAAAVVSVGIWLLIGQIASFERLGRALQTGDPAWLILAFAGVPFGYLGYAVLYRELARLDGGPDPGLPLALRLTVALFGASVLVTSAGRVGGEYWALRRMRERPAQAWPRVLAVNTAGWAVLSGLAFLSAIAVLARAPSSGAWWSGLVWLIVVPACVLSAVGLSAPSRRHLTRDSGNRLRRTLACALRGIVLLRQVTADRWTLARVLSGALLHWGGELLTVWAALHAFGVELGPAALVLGYATGSAVTMLPLPVGGAGGVDAAGAFALNMVGVPLSAALLATLVQRAFTYWLPLVIALVGARMVRRLPGDLAAVRGVAAVGSCGRALGR